jgi:hypothetical protein
MIDGGSTMILQNGSRSTMGNQTSGYARISYITN